MGGYGILNIPTRTGIGYLKKIHASLVVPVLDVVENFHTNLVLALDPFKNLYTLMVLVLGPKAGFWLV